MVEEDGKLALSGDLFRQAIGELVLQAVLKCSGQFKTDRVQQGTYGHKRTRRPCGRFCGLLRHVGHRMPLPVSARHTSQQ